MFWLSILFTLIAFAAAQDPTISTDSTPLIVNTEPTLGVTLSGSSSSGVEQTIVTTGAMLSNVKNVTSEVKPKKKKHHGKKQSDRGKAVFHSSHGRRKFRLQNSTESTAGIKSNGKGEGKRHYKKYHSHGHHGKKFG